MNVLKRQCNLQVLPVIVMTAISRFPGTIIRHFVYLTHCLFGGLVDVQLAHI